MLSWTEVLKRAHWWNSLQDTVTGLLLAGIGNVSDRQKKNFLVVDSSKPVSFRSTGTDETELDT